MRKNESNEIEFCNKRKKNINKLYLKKKLAKLSNKPKFSSSLQRSGRKKSSAITLVAYWPISEKQRDCIIPFFNV